MAPLNKYLSGRISLAVLLLVAAIALISCAVPSSAPHNAPTAVDYSQPVMLNAGDKIKLTVYGEEDINGEYFLDQRGIITLPLLGEIMAGGQTQLELQNHVRSEFVRRGFLSSPLVSVDIAALRPVYVLGEVNTPGSYAYEPSMTALKLVAVAGGYTPRAADGLFLIDRIGKDGKIARLNGKDITPILPGDTLIIRERIF